MCGIFAVSGSEQNAGSFVLAGLKKLEYRGYDSWGVAVKSNDEQVVIEKEVGKISDINRPFASGTEAFGHSRWATHGGVTRANAHPHHFEKITLVHNGVCENFLELKADFKAEEFSSETDSEVIAAVLNKFFLETNDPRRALQKTAEVLHGRFALLVMFEGVDGIFAVRRGSPLIIGRAENETYIASDIPAFLEQTNVVNYLDDNQGVFIQGGTAEFFDALTLQPIEKRNIEVSWQVQEAEKGDYDHFMLKEIFDQKETIDRSINHDTSVLEAAVKLLQSTNGAFLVACGTSHKVAMAAEYFFSEIAGKKVNVVPASEMKYFEKFVHEKTALIAISQSGETADIMEVIEEAKLKGAKILSLTNVESSSLARMADVNLPIQAGPEKAVASTKAATAQMAIMFLLAHGLAVGKPSKECFADNFLKHVNRGREILSTTASNISEMLNPRYEEHIKTIAEKIFHTPNLFIIGRGALYPMALEAAIKIQEVSYISAMGFAAGELKHGPIALIEKGTPCVVLGDDAETVSNAMELKARGAIIIGISAQKQAVFDEWIKVVDCGGAQAIASIVPVQILAYHLAVLKNLDPDMPRNLAKSVTVK
ncbi:glutamine--fructose-6-phosphate transaminase (isomerizing) [bacterium DOLZORAL124_38_8]|nr:MAG: glutamine--fructose-6-phosphate transaminase (isomerizing) [bacterium DOLZORAL124_38_8]